MSSFQTKKKLVVASGKGGVGKSMLASSLAMLFSQEKKTIALDCDVDAPNLAVWLGEPEGWEKIKRIFLSEKPLIDNSRIDKKQAKECLKKCRFKALYLTNRGKIKLNPFLCEGCGACEAFCPQEAVKMKPVKNGEIRIKKTKQGFPLVSGRLYPGETGSGKIVVEIKKFAFGLQDSRDEETVIIIDSAPGTGCPVTASLQDADFAVLVTETTLSGFADLKRVLRVVDHFRIPWALVINKWGVNKGLSRKMEKWAGKKFLGAVSYDKRIFLAVSNLKPVMETDLRAKKEIRIIYNRLKVMLYSKNAAFRG